MEIAANPERVWQILADFERYPNWNPFIRSMTGELAVGARLRVRVQPSGAPAMTSRPRVLKVEPNRELCWMGSVWLPG